MLALVVLPHGDLEIAPAAVLAFGLALSSASCGRSSEGAVLLTPEVSNLGLRATRVALADGLLVIEGNEAWRCAPRRRSTWRSSSALW